MTRKWEDQIINYVFDDHPHNSYLKLITIDPIVQIIRLYALQNKCIFCNRKFINKSALKNHMLHNDICSYKFIQIIRMTVDRLEVFYDYARPKKVERSIKKLKAKNMLKPPDNEIVEAIQNEPREAIRQRRSQEHG